MHQIPRQCHGGPFDGEMVTSDFQEGEMVMLPVLAETADLDDLSRTWLIAYYKAAGDRLEFDRIEPLPKG